jgi:hypothetical protein
MKTTMACRSLFPLSCFTRVLKLYALSSPKYSRFSWVNFNVKACSCYLTSGNSLISSRARSPVIRTFCLIESSSSLSCLVMLVLMCFYSTTQSDDSRPRGIPPRAENMPKKWQISLEVNKTTWEGFLTRSISMNCFTLILAIKPSKSFCFGFIGVMIATSGFASHSPGESKAGGFVSTY